MATYNRKVTTVEARVYDGPTLTVISDDKGEQRASKGDYLLGTEPGKVTVMTAVDFEREFEIVAENSYGEK
jgi:hypothetical protein